MGATVATEEVLLDAIAAMNTGKERVWGYLTVIAAIINPVLNVILILAFGILGAAIATAITMAGMKIVGIVMVRREIGILTLPNQLFSRSALL